MKKKVFDCIEMQRSIRNELLNEANNDLHTLVQQVKMNNKNSRFYKLLKERKAKQLTAAE
jgi:hypothetical protein